MSDPRRRIASRFALTSGVLGVLLLAASPGCGKRSGQAPSSGPSTLRIGVGGVPQQAARAGLRQVSSGWSVEPLANRCLLGVDQPAPLVARSEEHTSELQSPCNLV